MQPKMKSFLPAILMALLVIGLALPSPAPAQVTPPDQGVQAPPTLNPAQRRMLEAVARDTWNFYSADVDANTSLPRDNIGFNGAPAQGNYTSPTNVGVYLWSIVAAQDLHLINRHDAQTLLARAIGAI